MIRNGVVNGRIMGEQTYIDEDQIAAYTELPSSGPGDCVPDLLG
jgi:hypothetical protein